MKKIIAALAVLGAASLLGTAPAGAANINTSGSDCHAFFGDQQAGLNYLPTGLQETVAGSAVVQCPIPRSPLASGATSASFFIDGKTPASASTSCTVTSYNFNGAIEGSVSFTETNANATPLTFDHFVTFPAAQMTSFAYVSVFCNLVAGGTLFGVTSLQ